MVAYQASSLKEWFDSMPRSILRFMLKTRNLTRKDIASILKIEKSQENGLFFPSDIQDILKSIDSSCSLCLYDGNSIIAFVLVYHTEYGTSYLEKIFVSSAYRGNGIQNKLVKKALKLLSKYNVRLCYTMVNPHNEVSLSNFKSIGFTESWDTSYKSHNRKVLVYEVIGK